jgi:hypothetical protein
MSIKNIITSLNVDTFLLIQSVYKHRETLRIYIDEKIYSAHKCARIATVHLHTYVSMYASSRLNFQNNLIYRVLS